MSQKDIMEMLLAVGTKTGPEGVQLHIALIVQSSQNKITMFDVSLSWLEALPQFLMTYTLVWGSVCELKMSLYFVRGQGSWGGKTK